MADFDIRRNLVSRKMGKEMMQGWTLLDGSCPAFVIPLMTDGEGRPDTSVLCGPIVSPKDTEILAKKI